MNSDYEFCELCIRKEHTRKEHNVIVNRNRSRERYYNLTANSEVHRRGPYKSKYSNPLPIVSEEVKQTKDADISFYNSMIPSDDWDRTKPIHISNGFYVFPDGHISKS